MPHAARGLEMCAPLLIMSAPARALLEDSENLNANIWLWGGAHTRDREQWPDGLGIHVGDLAHSGRIIRLRVGVVVRVEAVPFESSTGVEVFETTINPTAKFASRA